MLSGSGSISMISYANLMQNGSKALVGQKPVSLILHSTRGIFWFGQCLNFCLCLGIEEWFCLVLVYHGNRNTYVTIFLRLVFCTVICLRRQTSPIHLFILDQFLLARISIIFSFDKIKSRHRILIHYIQRFTLLPFSSLQVS